MADDVFGIGALAAKTQVPVSTIRTWERRYGFPRAIRRPSGHRRYSNEEAERLALLIQAMDAGFRPQQISALSKSDLRDLLGMGQSTAQAQSGLPELPAPPPHAELVSAVDRVLDVIARLDRRAFDRELRLVLSHFGTLNFCLHLVPSVLVEVGRRWESGVFDVGHEHFASERIRDFLAEQWRRLGTGDGAGKIVLCTLPGEQHGLSLHLLAVLLSLGDFEVVFLGRNTPLSSVVAVVRESSADTVAVSISAAAERNRVRQQLSALSRELPEPIELLVGGTGAEWIGPLSGITRPDGLQGLWDWMRERGEER